MVNVVYIIGPFRADNSWLIEQNIRKAEEIALELWKYGFAVICPHTNTRFFNGAVDDLLFLEGDKEILKRCDAALCVNGWKSSKGSVEEIDFCAEFCIPCFYNFIDLLTFYRKV